MVSSWETGAISEYPGRNQQTATLKGFCLWNLIRNADDFPSISATNEVRVFEIDIAPMLAAVAMAAKWRSSNYDLLGLVATEWPVFSSSQFCSVVLDMFSEDSPRALFLHSSHKSFVSQSRWFQGIPFLKVSFHYLQLSTLTNSPHSRQTLLSWSDLQGALPSAQKSADSLRKELVLIDWICQFGVKLQTYPKSQRLTVIASF